MPRNPSPDASDCSFLDPRPRAVLRARWGALLFRARRPGPGLAALFAALWVLTAFAELATAQVFVVPRRPSKSRVRYFDFDWMHVDVLVGEEMSVSSTTATDGPGAAGGALFAATASSALARLHTGPTRSSTSAAGGDEEDDGVSRAGGIRLYFYRQEDVIAGRAAGSISDTYREFVDHFRYVPRSLFPYVLYSSYQEFLQTNLFPVQEGVLGVTSTEDLKLALPYFGDYRLFREVSRHEMAHQFTIQKVREIAQDLEIKNPLEAFPLWFIEGLAEFYAKGGLDEEAELLALDLVLNANIERGYGLIGFFADRPFSVLWTYKIGLVRCVFLEDTYGKGTIQRIMEASPLLVADVGDRARIPEFSTLVSAIVGDDVPTISSKFEAWLKRRVLPEYLSATQQATDLAPLQGFGGEYVESMVSSPSGNLLLYRTIDFETGQSKLQLFDWRAPDRDHTLAADGVPGVESLHPVAGRNFDLTDDSVTFVAEDNGADVLYWAPVEHEAKVGTPPAPRLPPAEGPRAAAPWPLPGLKPQIVWDTHVSTGGRIQYKLAKYGIVAAYSPAFSPEGDKIAFIGLDMQGARDIYVLVGAGKKDYDVLRVTSDEYGERALDWGPRGIVFTSDRTRHGKHNLFRTKPEPNAPIVQLTDEDKDHIDPTVLPDGTSLYVSVTRGRGNAFEIQDRGVVQRTDLPTGVFDLCPGPEGSIWALYHHAGERRIVRIPRDKFLNKVEPGALASAEGLDVHARPRLALEGAEVYDPWAVGNWQLDNIFALAGIGGGSVFGRVLAASSDRLRTHSLLLDISALGSFDLTDGYFIYVNEEQRLTWGAGPFQRLDFQVDPTFGRDLPYFYSAQRFFGATGILRYPFDRFTFVQTVLNVGGVGLTLDRNTKDFLRDYPGRQIGQNALDTWRDSNRGINFQTTASLSLGYDTIRYQRGTGPLAGSSVLAEGTVGVQPFDDEVFASLRLDAEQYFQIIGRVNFFLRGAAGSTFGGRFARQFFLSSFDTLRGVEFGDREFLLGRKFWYSTAELQIPLNAILALAFLTDIEGIAGFDFGGVSDRIGDLWDRRVLDFVLGFNFGLGPLVLRLHFAMPIDIGAQRPNISGSWVTNFSLGWVYF